MRFSNIIPFTRKELTNYSDPFLTLRKEVDALFDRSLKDVLHDNSMLGLTLDVRDEGSELIVEADVAGLSEKDLSISIDNGVLTIKGEKKRKHNKDDNNYYVSERFYGTFSRSIQLPFNVNADAIQAKLEKGVLKLLIHKPEGKDQGAQLVHIESVK